MLHHPNCMLMNGLLVGGGNVTLIAGEMQVTSHAAGGGRAHTRACRIA